MEKRTRSWRRARSAYWRLFRCLKSKISQGLVRLLHGAAPQKASRVLLEAWVLGGRLDSRSRKRRRLLGVVLCCERLGTWLIKSLEGWTLAQ